MRSRLSKFTASGLIIGARDYYPKVILLFSSCDSHAIVNHCKIIQSPHARGSKPLKQQTTPLAKNPYIKEIGRRHKIFYLVPNKLIYFILALAKSIYYSKCVNIATYAIIVIITHYYRSYFSSYSVALPRHKIKFKLNRPGSMLTSIFQG